MVPLSHFNVFHFRGWDRVGAGCSVCLANRGLHLRPLSRKYLQHYLVVAHLFPCFSPFLHIMRARIFTLQ